MPTYTFYAPGPGDRMEGGFETSRKNREGENIPRTLDDYRLGKSDYVTVASDPSRYGQGVDLGDITYRSPLDNKQYSLSGVKGLIHDTGSAFRGRPDKLDIATGDFTGWNPSQASAFVANNRVGGDGGDLPPAARATSYAPEPRRNMNPDLLSSLMGGTAQGGPVGIGDRFGAGIQTLLNSKGQGGGLVGKGLGLLSALATGQRQDPEAVQGREIGAAFQGSGGNWQSAAQRLMQAGHPDIAIKLLTLGQANSHSDRSYELQRQQFEEQKRQHGATESRLDRPSIVWKPEDDPTTGLRTNKPYLQDPVKGTIRPIDPRLAGPPPATLAPDEPTNPDETQANENQSSLAPAPSDEATLAGSETTGEMPKFARMTQGGMVVNSNGQEVTIPKIPVDASGKPTVNVKTWMIEQTKAAVKRSNTAQQDKASNDVVLQNLDTADKLVKEHPNLTTGLAGQVLSNVGGFKAHDLAQMLLPIESNIAFDRLNQMRQESKTGGALGAVSNQEERMLTSVLGSVKQSQTPEQLRFNLARLKHVYLETIHGKGNSGTAMPKYEDYQEGSKLHHNAPAPKGAPSNIQQELIKRGVLDANSL